MPGRSKISHIRDLTPDPKNARKHSPANIGQIVDALHHVGAARSIVLNEDGVILAGNGVVEAAAEAGITRVTTIEADGDEIIAVIRSGLTAEQQTELALADNRAGELSSWDYEVLAELADESPDVVETYWRPEEIVEFVAYAEQEQSRQVEDEQRAEYLAALHLEIEEPPVMPKHGEVWELGRHKLVIANIATDWPLWNQYLQDDTVFLPYPGPLILWSESFVDSTLLLVQPDSYLAGKVIEHYIAIHGDDEVSRID